MNFEFFAARRLIKARNDRSIRTVITIATVACAMSIAVMIAAVAILQGFKGEIKDKIVGFGAHCQIVPYMAQGSYTDSPLLLTETEKSYLKSHPNIKNFTPIVQKSGAIVSDNDFQAVIVKGTKAGYDTTFFHDNLVKGRLFRHNIEGRQEAIISSDIAGKMKAKVGDRIKVYFWVNDAYRSKKFTVTGIYETGLGDYDERFIICDSRPLQEVFSMQEQDCSVWEVTMKDFSLLDATAQDIYDNIGQDKSVTTITEMEPNLFSWLSLLDSNVVMIIIVMILVSIVTLSSVILIMIFEKKYLIGIMKSFGTPDRSIMKIFLYRAGYVILRGMIYGNILAVGLCLVQKYFRIITLDQQSYYLSSVPVEISVLSILLIDIGAFAVCILSLVIPARSITRMSPLKNIRTS